MLGAEGEAGPTGELVAGSTRWRAGFHKLHNLVLVPGKWNLRKSLILKLWRLRKPSGGVWASQLASIKKFPKSSLGTVATDLHLAG